MYRMTSSEIQKRRMRCISCSGFGRVQSRVSWGQSSSHFSNWHAASGASASGVAKETTYTPDAFSCGTVPHWTTPCRRKFTPANTSRIVVDIIGQTSIPHVNAVPIHVEAFHLEPRTGGGQTGGNPIGGVNRPTRTQSVQDRIISETHSSRCSEPGVPSGVDVHLHRNTQPVRVCFF